jgi:hypothetical protein
VAPSDDDQRRVKEEPMKTICALSAACMCLFAHAASAADTPPVYGPFEGAGAFSVQGYQELQLGPDRWYVAYQGNRSTAPAWVDAAWAARVAQLCQARGASHFVELRYSFEPVTSREPSQGLQSRPQDGWSTVLTATPVYIPIYTPSQPVLPNVAPAKLAAAHCVSGGDVLRDPARATAIADTLAEARKKGIHLAPGG